MCDWIDSAGYCSEEMSGAAGYEVGDITIQNTRRWCKGPLWELRNIG